MATLFSNHIRGALSADINSSVTTITSSVFASLPVVASPDIMYLTIDPDATAGAPEIVQVTAHTSASTSVTVVRGQQSTTARSHLAAVEVVAALTKADLDGFLVSADLDVKVVDLTWTPTFTNLTIGTTGASSVGRYSFSGDVLSCWGYAILGTGFSISPSPIVNIPAGFELDLSTFRNPVGTAQLMDASGAVSQGIARWTSVTAVQLLRLEQVGAELRHQTITSSTPFTWNVSDSIGFQFHAPAHTV